MIRMYPGRIYLDSIIPDEAFKWRNRHEIRFWCRQYSLISMAHHLEWLRKIETDPTIRMFGIKTLEYKPIGVCGLTSIDQVNQSAEFSLYIAEETGNGFGTDALITLVGHGFNDLNLNRIWGEVFDGNPAMTMFEKVGFKREGTLRQSYFREGKFIDSHIISVLRGDACILRES